MSMEAQKFAHASVYNEIQALENMEKCKIHLYALHYDYKSITVVRMEECTQLRCHYNFLHHLRQRCPRLCHSWPF